jgi:hypothetical protein
LLAGRRCAAAKTWTGAMTSPRPLLHPAQPRACRPPGAAAHLRVGDGAARGGGHAYRVLQVRARPLQVASLVQQPAVLRVGPVLCGAAPKRRLAQDPLVLRRGRAAGTLQTDRHGA